MLLVGAGGPIEEPPPHGLFHVAPMSTFVLTNGYATGSPTTCPYGTGANGAFTGMTAYTNVGTGGPAPHRGPVITRTG